MLNIDSNNTLTMGILNLTPDSFYDGNKNSSFDYFSKQYELVEKADIIDIGAESSRPGSKPITANREIERLKVLNDLNIDDKFLSIDSYKPSVLKYCLKNNFNMINDITGGGRNYANIDIASIYNVPICIMHMQGNPQNMQDSPKYDNLIDELICFFESRINYCIKIGFDLNKLVIDPGIGFGKTIQDNFNIIFNLHKFKRLGCKILIGLSRKSFLRINNDEPKERLIPSISMQAISILNGANIIRTHDVKETKESIQIIHKYNIANGNSRIFK